jgi:uncharacterized RDD family membrane protein YckC
MPERPTSYEFASALARIAAQGIDFVAATVGFLVVTSILPAQSGAGFVVMLIALALALIYRLLGDAIFGGAALGKRICGIRVVDAATRRPCSLGQCAIRAGILLLPLVPLVEIILLVIDGEERWGDRSAHTYVLRLHPRPAPEAKPLRPTHLDGLKDMLARPDSPDEHG